MKPVKFFYLSYCPHCRKAESILSEALRDQRFADVKIERIEESQHPEIAEQYDYYYVPCFYVGEVKIKEGILNHKDVIDVLEAAIA